MQDLHAGDIGTEEFRDKTNGTRQDQAISSS